MTELRIEPDAIMWSTPAAERSGRPLIVLLHGYGSHEGDLFALSPRLPLAATIASVRAPLQAGQGFAWWELTGMGTPEPSAVDAAAAAIIGWLDTIHAPSISLLGFSQGGVLSLQLMRTAPERFASAVCLAGFVAPGEHPGDTELAARKPPVFWGRGTDDGVIPDAAIERTAHWLPEHADATIRVYEGVGHSVSSQELTDLVSFLGEHSAP